MSNTTSTDPRITRAIEAGRIPEGISIAWLEESRDKPATGAIIFVTVLTGIVVLCRIASRAFVLRRTGLDDWLALLCLALLIAFVVLDTKLINIGAGRHYQYLMYVLTPEEVNLSEIWDFAAHIVYTIALLICRVSGLAFYHRICSIHRGFRLAIQILMGVLVAGFLPQLFLIIFHCLPVTGLWPYTKKNNWQKDVEGYQCLPWGLVYSVNSAVSLFCDLLLFGIPLAMIWILDLPRKRRLQLACILMPGILVTGISIARLVLVIAGQWNVDMSWTYNPLLAVEVSEIGATLISLSIPGIKPVFDKFIRNTGHDSNSGGHSGYSTKGGTKGTSMTLRNLSLRPQHHNKLSSNSDCYTYNDTKSRNRDDAETGSTEGIMVRVDFDLTTENEHRGSKALEA
ncbi:hypothetical protein B0H65DRAFT_208549 [Neurospora tetraspora]|uniref:Rhodopsin domain-containing protein n=1 Tax=Neurospora tetraspora TaxID=94610 RepID=A0AAE0MRY8_9PEZI|nr:hypothetical protein B0H65DRAFT_208549 [Neurospora tetraspora]